MVQAPTEYREPGRRPPVSSPLVGEVPARAGGGEPKAPYHQPGCQVDEVRHERTDERLMPELVLAQLPAPQLRPESRFDSEHSCRSWRARRNCWRVGTLSSSPHRHACTNKMAKTPAPLPFGCAEGPPRRAGRRHCAAHSCLRLSGTGRSSSAARSGCRTASGTCSDRCRTHASVSPAHHFEPMAGPTRESKSFRAPSDRARQNRE